MNGLATRLARIAIGGAFAIGIGGDAVARTIHRHIHHVYHLGVHRYQLAQPLYVASQQPVRLGPMRYYGGPKSPMWRAPIEN
jgi:hypothetical protein